MEAIQCEALHRVPKLIFVDDEPFILSALKRLFRSFRLEVHSANSAEEAIDIISREDFDVVISDMRMPGKSGLEVLERAAKLIPDCQRILLTGYSDEKTTIEAINLGHVHQYVSKPWNDEGLREIVTGCLQTIATKKQHQMPTRQINRSLRRKMNNDYTIEIEQIRAIQQSHKALQTNLDTCLQFFSQIINMRLPKSGSNVASAAVIVNQIGINIGLNEMQRQHLYMATLFRDIGKINFPDSIIKIPFENLTTAQQQEFRKHPDIGASYFFSHKNFEQVALIVQQHREYCNGSGYPRGLNSLAICMEAKILCAVSDYCDWQNSDIHSPSKTPPQAIEILKKNSQQHYDPGVVKALVEWFESQMNANKGMNEVRLHCHALNPGMTTSANIVNNRGHLLVAKDTVLDQIFIDKLIEMEKKLSEPIYISINDKIH